MEIKLLICFFKSSQDLFTAFFVLNHIAWESFTYSKISFSCLVNQEQSLCSIQNFLKKNINIHIFMGFDDQTEEQEVLFVIFGIDTEFFCVLIVNKIIIIMNILIIRSNSNILNYFIL